MTFEPINDHLLHQLERPLDLPIPTSAFPGMPAQPARSPASSPIELFLLSDVPSQPLSWLWPGRIPLGHLTLLDAAPDCGLSLFTLALAACVSRGSPLPDGTPTPQGNVLLLAPYDSASHTIKPRLEAAGGDPAHVLLLRPPLKDASRKIPHGFTLPQDLDQLATTIRCFDARLVILDPASALAGLSRCLPALLELAQQTNCAILLTRSLQKPPATPFSAAPASPLLEVARSRLLLTPNPVDEHTCLLVTTKHSLCTQPSLLAYEILATAQGIPTLHWLGASDRPSLTRLCTGPIRSLHRQAILRFLHHSPTPHSIKDILSATSYDPEAGRKMLLRMKQAGEVVPVAPGVYLYTIPNHPCLTHESAHPDPDTPQSSVPPVPLVPPLDHHTAAAPPATETSCATGAPLPMEARPPEDPVGEVCKDGEQSDAGCVGARLIAPLDGVGHTSPTGSATNVPPVPHGSPPNGSIPHNPHVPPLTNVPPVPASENSTSHLPPLPIPQRNSEPDRPVPE